MKCSDFLWGDSTLEAIYMRYECIDIVVFNDCAKYNVVIKCYDCVRVSQIDIDDDWIIDNVVINQIPTSISGIDRMMRPEIGDEVSIVKLRMISGREYQFLCGRVELMHV